MIVLGLDPARSTGFARCDVNVDGVVRLVKYGVIEVKSDAGTDGSGVGKTCLELYEKLEPLFDPLPDAVFIEDYFASSRTRNGTNLNLYLRAVVALKCEQKGIAHRFLTPTEWKTHVTGMRGGRPTKAMKQSAGAKANKLVIVDALRDRYGVTFPSHITIDGKKRVFKHDISDAVGICFCGIHKQMPHAMFPRTSGGDGDGDGSGGDGSGGGGGDE